MSRFNALERTTEVRAYIAYGSGRKGRTATLRVDDRRSGLVMLEVNLTPEAYQDMLSTTIGVESPATVRISDNIGRWAEHKAEHLSVSKGDEVWAANQGRMSESDGWQFTGCSRNNRGQWVLRFVRYHDQPEEAGSA